MQNMEHNMPLANNHISVDCVVIGFDGEQLKVLLIKRAGEEEGEIFHDMKLPGSLIYMDEDLDEAAQRVLNELTGLKNVNHRIPLAGKDRPCAESRFGRLYGKLGGFAGHQSAGIRP